jgi:hypothetical protein
MNNRTAKDMPRPMLRYIGDGKFSDMRNSVKDENVLVHWLFQDLGETYRLQWFGSGWVVNFQESYLTKDLHFTHKNDIPGFDYSHFPFAEAEKWQHVFETSDDAIEAFKTHYCKLRGIEPCKNLSLECDIDLPISSAMKKGSMHEPGK